METTTIDPEEVGRIADSIDNVISAMKLPLPPEKHVEYASASLRSIRDELRAVVITALGENPWDGQEDE